MKSLIAPFDAYKGTDPYVFISYAHKNSETVFRHITRLRDEGFRIWYDEGIDPGTDWSDEIAAALNNAAAFLVFISPESVESHNVKKEIVFALSKRKHMIAVHIAETELPLGLQMQLGNIQAILEDRFIDREKFYDRLFNALPDEVCDPNSRKPKGGTGGVVSPPPTPFASPQLEQAVRLELDLPEGAVLKSEDLSTMIRLRVAGDVVGEDATSYTMTSGFTIVKSAGGLHHSRRGNVRILTDIPRMGNLEELVLVYQSFVDLSPLTGMNLKNLDISYNNVNSLSPIATLPVLRNLSFKGISQAQLDTLFATQGARLIALSVMLSPDLTNIRKIASLQHLEHLVISKTSVEDISPIAGLPSLKTISMGEIPCKDYSTLKHMAKLEEVVVYNKEQERAIRALFDGNPPFVIR